MTAMIVLLYRLTTCNMSDMLLNQTGSREQKAFRKSAAIFKTSIDPTFIISALHNEQLLTDPEWNQATQKTLTDDERVDAVWRALVRRVAANSRVFHLVVKILCDEPAMKALGDQMQSMSRKGFNVDHLWGVALWGQYIYMSINIMVWNSFQLSWFQGGLFQKLISLVLLPKMLGNIRYLNTIITS